MIDKILIADDEFMLREVLVETISRHNIEVHTACDANEAIELINKHDFQLAFVDLKMGRTTGMDVLKHCVKKSPKTLFVIMTAYGTTDTAIDALKLGAYDFVMKPFSPDQTDIIIEKARRLLELQEKQEYLTKELSYSTKGKTSGSVENKSMLGTSSCIDKIRGLIEKVAKSPVTVLITGESGTGKEMVSAAIEESSNPDGKKPYIRMNCAAVPENLIESELFGHEKGAFTGASERRVGRFELADGGTLLLDEIGEVPLSMQAKLLRVLQESEFERVGGNKTIKVDTRILATTNRDLRKEVDEGRFREDLFYRLNVVPIFVPPLRERPGDPGLLAEKFLKRISARQHKDLKFAKETIDAVNLYPWPGNVRELENMIERLAVLEDGPAIKKDALPEYILYPKAIKAKDSTSTCDSFLLADIEREAIFSALKHTHGKREKAADIMGITSRTLRNKMKEYEENGLIPKEMQS